jgi:hypothetical protein
MFRPATDILKPDPRHETDVSYNQTTGQLLTVTMVDWHACIAKIELAQHVPERIRNEFDKARNAFLYSWFSYELATLAEYQALVTLEMAIRERLIEHDPGISLPRGLDKLRLAAKDRELLNEGNLALIDRLRWQRNEIVHGSDYLFPQASLEIIKCCADLIQCPLVSKTHLF